jgi:hypothetical protein
VEAKPRRTWGWRRKREGQQEITLAGAGQSKL